jgi:hypothetical protein
MGIASKTVVHMLRESALLFLGERVSTSAFSLDGEKLGGFLDHIAEGRVHVTLVSDLVHDMTEFIELNGVGAIHISLVHEVSDGIRRDRFAESSKDLLQFSSIDGAISVLIEDTKVLSHIIHFRGRESSGKVARYLISVLGSHIFLVKERCVLR